MFAIVLASCVSTALAPLRQDRAAARKAAGRTPLDDPAHGWIGGYPAALLPLAGATRPS